jgi:hypothetical protein
MFFIGHVFVERLHSFGLYHLFFFYCLYSYRSTCVGNLFPKEDLPVSVASASQLWMLGSIVQASHDQPQTATKPPLFYYCF